VVGVHFSVGLSIRPKRSPSVGLPLRIHVAFLPRTPRSPSQEYA